MFYFVWGSKESTKEFRPDLKLTELVNLGAGREGKEPSFVWVSTRKVSSC